MRKVRLGDHLRFTRGTSLSGDYYATCGDHVRLTLGNFDFKENRFKENTAKSNIYFTGSFKPIYLLSAGDVITPLTEQTRGLLGSTARIPDSDRYILSQDIAKIESLDRDILLSYAYYLFPSTVVRKQLDAGSQQTKIRHTSVSKLEDLIAFVPPIEEQNQIVSFLSRLDSLIECYDKQIQELEQTSQDIYDYWFVQYDFPDENGNPYRSSGGKMTWNNDLNREIPVGWQVKSFLDVAQIVNGGTPPTKDPENYVGDIPWVTPKDLSDQGKKFTSSSYRSISNEALKYATRQLLPTGTILLTSRAPIGLVSIAAQPCTTNQGFKNLIVDGKHREYLYYKVKKLVPLLVSLGSGTTFREISKTTLGNVCIAIPDDTTLNTFHQTASAIFRQQQELQTALLELRDLRDLLMPLLLNGQTSFKIS